MINLLLHGDLPSSLKSLITDSEEYRKGRVKKNFFRVRRF
jgi:hypothetical protein